MDQLLLAEFDQQHQNIRQIETLMFQKAQFYLSLEGLVVGGVLAIAGSQVGLSGAIEVGGPLMLFMTAVGHYILRSTVLSVAKMNELDFANRLVRIYFGRSGDRGFDAFMPSPAEMAARTGGNWAKSVDQSLLLAHFIAFITSANAFLASILILAVLAAAAGFAPTEPGMVGLAAVALGAGWLGVRMYRRRYVDEVLSNREILAINRENQLLAALALVATEPAIS